MARKRRTTQVSPAEFQKLVARGMRERDELQENVRQMAVATRWRYYHTQRSDHSPEGFPDCIMVRQRPGEICLLVYELKRQSESPTPAQQGWLNDFTVLANAVSEMSRFLSKGGLLPRVLIRVGCWRPMDWLDDTIKNILTDPASH